MRLSAVAAIQHDGCWDSCCGGSPFIYRTRGFLGGIGATVFFLFVAASFTLLEWGGEYAVYYAKVH
jgi:hypothetical protein